MNRRTALTRNANHCRYFIAQLLSNSPVTAGDGSTTDSFGNIDANSSIYQASSGAWVFAAGTNNNLNCVVNVACTFDASASTGAGTLSYKWNFGDGTVTTPNTAVTTHTYTCGVGSGSSAPVSVTLTVTDTTSRPAATATKTITVTRPGCGG